MALDYHTSAQVKVRLQATKWGNDSSSIPTNAEAEAIMESVENEVDSALEDLYTVPISGTLSLSVVKEMCILKTSGKIAQIQGAQGSDAYLALAREWIREADQMLKDIVSGVKDLSDATVGKTAELDTQVRGSFTTTNTTEDSNPSFTVTEVV